MTALVAVLAVSFGSACTANRANDDVSVSARDFDHGTVSVRSPSSRPGGTLRVVMGAVDSFDPGRSYYAGVWNVMRLYTRQLVTYAPAPGGAGTQLVPDLATGLGTSTDGGRTWKYRLKPGVKFEDGTVVTSRDIKYGIERLFASDVITGGPAWAVAMLDDPGHSYEGPYVDGTADKLALASIKTPDDNTIEFRLNRPFADWDYVMALPSSSPVPRRRDTRDKYGEHPVSLGPYKFASKNAAQIKLVRNENWSQQTDSVRRALPDEVEVTYGLSPDQRDQRLLESTADVDVTGSGLQPRSATKVLGDAKLKSRADNPTTGNVRVLALPTVVKPMDNPHCRRAVQFAIDKARVKEALGGPYAATLSTSLWPRGLPGYPATVRYPAGAGNHGDLAAARRELASCGHPDGFETRMASVNTGRGLRAAEEVQKALARVGINAKLSRFAPETFLLSDVGSADTVHRAQIGLIMSAWTSDYPSPSAFYLPLTDAQSIKEQAANSNLAELSTASLMKSVGQASGTLERGTALTLWQRYDASVMESAAYVPVVEDRALVIGSDRLHNAYIHRAYGGYDVVTLGVS